MPRKKKLSKKQVVEQLAKLQPRCSEGECNQYPFLEADRSVPPIKFLEPRRMYVEEDGTRTVGGDLTSTISHPSKRHASGKCYYHMKKSKGLFNAMSGNRTKEVIEL